MAKSPIVGAFSKSRSGNLADSDLYNLIVEIVETKDGKTAGALYNTAGLDLIGTLGSGPVRGAGVLNGVLYVVSGPSVYSLTPNGLATLCGGVGGGSSPVSMFQNTLQLMIVNGIGAWLVPGGYPLTGASVASGGSEYAVNDTVTMQGATGAQSSYVILRILATGAGGAVTRFQITQAGSATAVPVTLTQRSTSGSGAGLVLGSLTYGAFAGLVPVSVPFPNPLMGAVSDGFGLLVFQGSQYIAQSDELDLSTWGPLNYGVSDQSPDNCMAVSVIHDEAFILKERATEVWTDAGTAGFAFAPLQGVHIEWGCYAPFSVAKMGDRLAWLARNDQGKGEVVIASGYTVHVVSTQALTAEFDGYSNLGDAIGYSFQQGGHTFYVLTLPEANRTWFYDETTSALLGVPAWGRMAAWSDGQWNRHWGNCYVPWRGAVTAVNETTSYQPEPVTFTGTVLATPGGLTGLPEAFYCAVMSVWLYLPDTGYGGIVFGNQGASATPGLSVTVQNDDSGSPQIAVAAWDSSAAAIVSATYDFSGWSSWVNVLVSIDTATQQLQVYANRTVSSALTETELSPVSLTWTSTNAIAPSPSQRWVLAPFSASSSPLTTYSTITGAEAQAVGFANALLSFPFGLNSASYVPGDTLGLYTVANTASWAATLSGGSLDPVSVNGSGSSISAALASASPNPAIATVSFTGTNTTGYDLCSATVAAASAHGTNAISTGAFPSSAGAVSATSGQLASLSAPGIQATAVFSNASLTFSNSYSFTSTASGISSGTYSFHAGGTGANAPTLYDDSSSGECVESGSVSLMSGLNGTPQRLQNVTPPSVYVVKYSVSSSAQVTIADLFFSPVPSFVDFTVQANRRLFVSNTGGAQDIGANPPFGATPPVLLSRNGTPASFAANEGRGGPFNVTGGSLSAGAPNPPGSAYNVVTVESPASANGVLGDYLTGNLYSFNPKAYTDNGTAKRWLRRWRALPGGSPEAKRFSALNIDMIQVGTQVPPAANPQVMLRWSDDGGHSWSDWRIQAAGQLGQTNNNVKFNRLGSTRRFGPSDRIFELSSADPFSVAIVDADVDVS